MKNWFKKNEEIIFNVLLKTAGILNIILSFLYLFNFYQPNKLNIFTDMFLLGLIFTFVKWTSNKNIKGENK